MKLDDCPIRATLDLIGAKWKPMILWYLMNNTQRFNDFKRNIEDISNKSLTQHLRELESDGLITRRVYPDEMPLRVEYDLTELGASLTPILMALSQWGRQHHLLARHD